MATHPLQLRIGLALGLIALTLGGCATRSQPVSPVPSTAAGSPPSIVAPACTPLAPSSAARPPRDIGALLAPVIAQARIPGMVAVVLRGDQVIAQGAAGVRKRGTTVPVTLNDEFEICSCAKAMAATLVARLVEEGKLNWQTTLGDVFGDTIASLNPAWKAVTLQQVLAHRSGLSDHLMLIMRNALFARGDLTRQRLSFVANALSHAPDYSPGAKFVYASANYIVAAAMLEKITGHSWEDLMREQLFAPLGLASAGFGPPSAAGRLDQPWGHGRRRLLYVPLPGSSDTPFDPESPEADYPLAGSPAGLVHMSVPDWAKFVALHLRGDPLNPHRHAQFLSPEMFARLHQPAPGADYSAGWFVGTRPWAKGSRPGDTGRVLFHQGDNGRWNCVVWVAPEIDFAVLIACNRASEWGPVDQVARILVGKFAAAAP